jgi:predicted SprT family Zn-dependent metalloprotease
MAIVARLLRGEPLELVARETNVSIAYDRAHLALYVRLLDAAEEGAEWKEVVQVLFGLDPNRERERAHRVYDSHLARARWMTEHGYRDLLRAGMH